MRVQQGIGDVFLDRRWTDERYGTPGRHYGLPEITTTRGPTRAGRCQDGLSRGVGSVGEGPDA